MIIRKCFGHLRILVVLRVGDVVDRSVVEYGSDLMEVDLVDIEVNVLVIGVEVGSAGGSLEVILIVGQAELLEDGYGVRWEVGIFVTRNHMRGEELDDLRVSHFVIFIRVDLGEQIINFIILLQKTHRLDELSELFLVQVSDLALINLFE